MKYTTRDEGVLIFIDSDPPLKRIQRLTMQTLDF